jgi:hypothetical protein
MSEPTTTAALDDYLTDAVEAAREAFWLALAAAFPLASTGDMQPEDVDRFDEAATAAARAWIRTNIAHPRD